MQLFSDVLDDPILTDGQASFRGGQVSNRPARDLQPDEAAELLNCDITELGNIVTRRGTVRLGAGTIGNLIKGLTYYDTAAQSRLIAFTEVGAKYWDGAAWVSLGIPLIGIGGISNRVSSAQGIDRLYMADGSNNVHSWDGTVAANLGSGVGQPPGAARYLVWHTNRLCAAGMDAERNTIYFSQFLDGAVWDKTSWLVQPGQGEDDYITGLVPWTDFNLIVLKRRSIWLVNTNPTLDPSEFEIRPIHRRIGCPEQKTAVQVGTNGSDVYFLSDSGVRSVKRTLAAESQSEIGPPLSAPVQNIIDRIQWASVSQAAATFWNNRYILSIPVDAVAQELCLVYNTLTDSWSGTWTGWEARHFSYRHPTGSVPRMVFADNNEVFEWYDYLRRDEETSASYEDNGSNILTRIRTRGMTFGERRSDKTGLNVEVDFYDNHANGFSMTLNGTLVSPAFGTIITNAYAAEAVSLQRSFGTQHRGPHRDHQFQLTSTSGKLGVRSISATAFLEAMKIEQ